MGTDTVKRWRREGMPACAGGYDLAEVVAWLRTDGPWRARVGSIATEEIEGDGSGLERLRMAQALKAEWEYERLQGLWIAREQVHQLFAAVAQSIRAAGELLDRHFGREALEILTEALDEARNKIDALAQPAGDDAPGDS